VQQKWGITPNHHETNYWPREQTFEELKAEVAYKAKTVHTNNNPTTSMLEKDPKLLKLWLPAINKEIQGMISKGTLRKATNEEINTNKITPHVTTLKTKSDNVTLKARISIDGRWELRNGYFKDKRQLYAGAMGETLVKLLLALYTYRSMHMRKLDVVQCFGNNTMDLAKYKRNIMIKLKGWMLNEEQDQHCIFEAVSYGAADASNEWYTRLNKFEQEKAKMTRSIYDCCLYMKKNEQTGDVELQGVATDDSGVFTENNEAGKIMRDDLTNKMAKQWNITVEDEPQQILGMTLQRNKDGSLTILQPNILDKLFIAIYCDKLDKDPKVNYAKIHIQLTPYKKERTIADKLSPKLDTKGIKKYQHILGIMQHLRYTRADLKVAITTLAATMMQPTKNDFKYLIQVCNYALTFRNVGTTFHTAEQLGTTKGEIGNTPLVGAGDASWGRQPKSTLGYIGFIGEYNNLIKSKTIYNGPFIAKAWTEEDMISDSVSVAELQALNEIVGELQIIHGIFDEIKNLKTHNSNVLDGSETKPPTVIINRKTPILEDNSAIVDAIEMDTSKNQRKLRKYARLFQRTRLEQSKGRIQIQQVSTEHQLADAMTKYEDNLCKHFRSMEIIQGTSNEIKQWQLIMEAYKTQKQRMQAIQQKIGGMIIKIPDERKVALKHKTNANTAANSKITQITSELHKKIKAYNRKMIDNKHTIKK
jgi:hypothetical protein